MESRELFALFDQAGDAAFAVEPYGRICYWSDGAEKLLGFPRAEALTKHWIAKRIAGGYIVLARKQL